MARRRGMQARSASMTRAYRRKGVQSRPGGNVRSNVDVVHGKGLVGRRWRMRAEGVRGRMEVGRGWSAAMVFRRNMVGLPELSVEPMRSVRVWETWSGR